MKVIIFWCFDTITLILGQNNFNNLTRQLVSENYQPCQKTFIAMLFHANGKLKTSKSSTLSFATLI